LRTFLQPFDKRPFFAFIPAGSLAPGAVLPGGHSALLKLHAALRKAVAGGQFIHGKARVQYYIGRRTS
jgi:hypothetical protein